jgi:dCMP deaminase
MGQSSLVKEIDQVHMKVAFQYAELSKAKRLKVGAIIVKNDRIISIGYNGTPAGWDNECEKEVSVEENCILDHSSSPYKIETVQLITKPEVIHAEANAIGKLARSNESGLDSVMYITHSPCFECAKLIYVAGIKKVFYKNDYRNTNGIDFLNKCNVEIIKA